MIANNVHIFVILGSVIIFALAFYAGKLLMQLKQQAEARNAAEQQAQQAHEQHDRKVLNSVIIIVRAMAEEQCDLSEGCWRLSVLLDSLKTSTQLAAQFPNIFKLYQEIKHMPILEERKKLAKQERMKLDLERMKLEAELKANILEELKLLQQYASERSAMLATK